MSLEAAVDQEKFFSIFELRQILAVPRCRGHLLSWVHLFLVRNSILISFQSGQLKRTDLGQLGPACASD